MDKEICFSEGRRGGKTMKQMQSAPTGAVYIWPNNILSYPHQLAVSLGRQDLVIVSPAWLDNDRNLRGQENKVILDHATKLTPRQFDGWGILHLCKRT